ncbi:MAG: hypothetical protein K2X48_04525 [Chitinophagaceae bacterium]|nr:hypothetical protein [Chitinophagaceae bacterium]
MKPLFIISALLILSLSAVSQNKRPVVNDSSIYPGQPLLLQERIVGKSPYGTVYLLPQDNMPVVVADSNLVKQMPNSFKGTMKGTMPNPYYPRRKLNPIIIPDSLKGKPFVIPKSLYDKQKKH